MNDLYKLHLNNLTNQSILISALLCGFSLMALIMLSNNNEKSRLKTSMFICSSIASLAFLIVILADHSILKLTTQNGYHFSPNLEIDTLQVISGVMFALGFLAVIFLISYSGWVKSKQIGIFTTILGILTLIFGFLLLP